ncbi:MAG: hypothetical protein [Wendovervirus sonii]|uniref:Exonuclease n=1 Tax=phage Lak_Megaphage_Sonny TaxID=3109229 RepID=A0ABZ0Z5R5_9CAUD|nr:MAG: hypothetical protein [phage Lak_Megaphage_Sonny]
MSNYDIILEKIDIAVNRALNENGVESIEKQMYEQERMEGETWKQMADRVGFTKWYAQQGLTTKNIGDTYAKRRQRWLANICNDKNMIKKEIVNLEDCMQYSFLNDDNYLNSQQGDKETYIKSLESKISELVARIDELSKYKRNSKLNLSGVYIDSACDLNQLHFRETSFTNGSYDAHKKYRRDCIYMFEYIKKQLEIFQRAVRGTFGKYKALIVTYHNPEEIREDTAKILNSKFNIDCTGKEIYFIQIDIDEQFLLMDNFSAFKQFMQMINSDIKVYKYYDKYNWRNIFFYLIEVE